jgi:hypothetical protein
MPHKVNDDELVNVGLMALEDEMKAWRHVTVFDGYVRLVRYPPVSLLEIGPAEVPDGPDATVEMRDVKKDEVWPFLRWRGMQAAVRAIKATQAEAA